jgi:hypothetical protein
MVARWLIQSVFCQYLLRLIGSFLDKYDVTFRFVCKHAYMSLKASRFPRDDGIRVCQYAADNGHLSVLQWLRAQQPPCPWNDWVCSSAAIYGHLHILQWARAQDPP